MIADIAGFGGGERLIAEMAGFRGGKRKGGEPRGACKYGANCYQKSRDHKAQFSHPGDADWFGAPAPRGRSDAEVARSVSFSPRSEVSAKFERLVMDCIEADSCK